MSVCTVIQRAFISLLQSPPCCKELKKCRFSDFAEIYCKGGRDLHFVEVWGPDFFLQKLKQSSMRTSATMSRLEFLNLSGIVISVTESLNLKESMPTTTQSEREYPDPQQHHPHMFALITTATTTSKAVCRVVCLVVFTLKMVIYCPQGSGTLRQQCKVYCILHCIEQYIVQCIV